jgi:hypothetical protein
MRAVKLQGIAVLLPYSDPVNECHVNKFYQNPMNNDTCRGEAGSEIKSSLYVEQGYIVHTQHSPTCYEEEYVLECDSRSYGCSMISRLV